MGWTETCAVDERMRFVMAVENREEAFAAMCRRFGISRKTGYKWLGRYEEAGVEGLTDHLRAPLAHPHAITETIAERCVAVRPAHPTWGPVKVLAWLERHAPQTQWPAVSTIGALFDREGLTVKRRLRRRSPPSSAPFAHCGAANDVWCVDFKGWFLTGDGTHCEPLTLSDAYSRYLLRRQAIGTHGHRSCVAGADAAFRDFGRRIGCAFLTMDRLLRARGGRTFEAVGERDQGRGRPCQKNCPRHAGAEGRLERLNLTLLQDTAKSPVRSTGVRTWRALHNIKRLYNEDGPACSRRSPARRRNIARYVVAALRRWHG